jgi:hypothetical protein
VCSIALAALLAGCAWQFKQEEKALKQPINCATAEGDLRALHGEKAHVAQQIAMGVTALVPASAVVGLVTGTEVTKFHVATGQYNKMIDARIAEIQATCEAK